MTVGGQSLEKVFRVGAAPAGKGAAKPAHLDYGQPFPLVPPPFLSMPDTIENEDDIDLGILAGSDVEFREQTIYFVVLDRFGGSRGLSGIAW